MRDGAVSNVRCDFQSLKQNRWKESAEKFLVSLAFVLADLFAVMGSQALVFEVFSSASFYESAQAITFLIANAVMFGLFFYHRSKTRDDLGANVLRAVCALVFPRNSGDRFSFARPAVS